jgi:hypothetical protein
MSPDSKEQMVPNSRAHIGSRCELGIAHEISVGAGSGEIKNSVMVAGSAIEIFEFLERKSPTPQN